MMLRPLEQLATQTLLGIRFWDRHARRAVADGLHVTAQLLSDDRSQRLGRTVVGRATPGGVIAFFGLTSAEAVAADPTRQIWDTEPPASLIAVDVIDRPGRYLPLSFVARLPFRGAFRGRGDWLSTPLLRPIPAVDEEPGVDLWPSAAYGPPPGLAVIRAQLAVGSDPVPPPASFALVEITQPVPVVPDSPPRGRGRGRGRGNNTPAPASLAITRPAHHFGLADANGGLLLPLPYPPVPDPESDEYPPLAGQTVNLTVAIFHDPAITGQTLPGSATPNLENILNQPPADIGTHWNAADPPVLQTSTTLAVSLEFGRPLILRTALGGPDTEEKESILRIQP